MSLVRVKSQLCQGISQYDRCSPNSACVCFYLADAIDVGICGNEFVNCPELVPCERSNNFCREPNHRCVHHPRCHNLPVCYPIPSFNQQLCPPIAMIPNIPINAQWIQNGVTVAGGHGRGNATNQLYYPESLLIDNDQIMIIADSSNHRIIQWKMDDTNGQVIAGGNGEGNSAKEGIIVAGGQGPGNAMTQLQHPHGLFVDTLGTLYVADALNHRVMRWPKEAKQGTVIVGGNGEGAGANQFKGTTGLSFDRQGNLYVVDWENHRVQRFSIE
ncbi:unnamed protein product [Rotaria sordida]|uniref:Uncharacterized protein n=1 Tax=Rotaria sordida TaxID=392033 RepID=A0A815MZ13_9BILA|nr:unnamed protein product [Rotaria sordida]